MGRPDGHALSGSRYVSGNRSGNAEIRHQCPPILGNEDVVDFDVPVDDPGLVGELERPCHLPGQVDHFVLLERAVPFQQAGQGVGIVIHREVGRLAVASNV